MLDDAVTNIWHLVAPGTFTPRRHSLPTLKRDRVRVRMVYCGVCGSDVSHFAGRRTGTYPKSLGHEFVGVIEMTGIDVTGFSPGTVVVTDLNYRCGRCVQCLDGRSHLCEIGQISHFSNRGFATRGDYHYSYLHALSSQETRPQHVLCEPLSCVLHAIDRTRLCQDDRVLIIGAGGLGVCMTLALNTVELREIPRLWDHKTERLETLQRLSAVLTTEDLSTTDSFDVVFDLTGTPEGLAFACDNVRRGGKLISMSHLDGFSNTSFLLPKLTRKDIWFTVSYLNGEKESLGRAETIVDRYWNDEWDEAIAIHKIRDIGEAFRHRDVSTACKDIIQLESSP